MKKKNQRPSLSKFRVSQLNSPNTIMGGGETDGGGTDVDPEKDKCQLASLIISND